jgi:hypothetical protein
MPAARRRLGLELLLAKNLQATRLWRDLVVTPSYRTVVAGRDPLRPDAGRSYFGRWHNPRVTGAWYLQTSLAEFAHHREDGTYQVDVLEADVGFQQCSSSTVPGGPLRRYRPGPSLTHRAEGGSPAPPRIPASYTNGRGATGGLPPEIQSIGSHPPRRGWGLQAHTRTRGEV